MYSAGSWQWRQDTACGPADTRYGLSLSASCTGCTERVLQHASLSIMHLWQGCIIVDLQEQWQEVAAKFLQQLWVLLQK